MSSEVLMGIQMAGSGLSAGGSIMAGNAEAASLKSQAEQYRENARLARASSQRRAIEEVRAGEAQQSRVLALVAAGGGGASDPSVVTALARMSGDTDYAKRVALYEGEMEAVGNERQAAARIAEAKSVKQASRLKAFGSILSAGASMYDRYAGGGPKNQTTLGGNDDAFRMYWKPDRKRLSGPSYGWRD